MVTAWLTYLCFQARILTSLLEAKSFRSVCHLHTGRFPEPRMRVSHRPECRLLAESFASLGSKKTHILTPRATPREANGCMAVVVRVPGDY